VLYRDDGRIHVWATGRDKPEQVLLGHQSDVKCVEWHPQRALIASGSRDASIRLWDPKQGKCIRYECVLCYWMNNVLLGVKFEDAPHVDPGLLPFTLGVSSIAVLFPCFTSLPFLFYTQYDQRAQEAGEQLRLEQQRQLAGLGLHGRPHQAVRHPHHARAGDLAGAQQRGECGTLIVVH
jgi:hypothetical protein